MKMTLFFAAVFLLACCLPAGAASGEHTSTEPFTVNPTPLFTPDKDLSGQRAQEFTPRASTAAPRAVEISSPAFTPDSSLPRNAPVHGFTPDSEKQKRGQGTPR